MGSAPQKRKRKIKLGIDLDSGRLFDMQVYNVHEIGYISSLDIRLSKDFVET